MAYFVNGTDGNITAVVEDGTVNTDTSLKLIGIGYPQYAETVAENFVGLLENFSSPNAPSNPIKGQTWFNTSINQLQVFDGDIFRAVNNVKVSDSEPSIPREGDFWYDSIKKQMFFRRGAQWQLVAPTYSVDQGRTEFVAEWITDEDDVQHVVLTLFNNGKRALIIGTDDKFRTHMFNGFSWINPGINIPNYLQKSSGVFWAGNGNAYADSGLTVGGSTSQIQYNSNGFLAGANITTTGTDLTSPTGTFQSKNVIANEIKSLTAGYIFPDNTTQTTAAIIDDNTVSGFGDLFSMAYFDDTADANSISGTPQITTDGTSITAQAGTITAKNLSLTQLLGGKLTFADGTEQTTAAFNNTAAVNGTGVVNQLAYFTSTTQVSGTSSMTTNGTDLTLASGALNAKTITLTSGQGGKIVFADGTEQSTAAVPFSGGITGSGSSTRLAYFTGTSSVSGASSITTNGTDLTVGGQITSQDLSVTGTFGRQVGTASASISLGNDNKTKISHSYASTVDQPESMNFTVDNNTYLSLKNTGINLGGNTKNIRINYPLVFSDGTIQTTALTPYTLPTASSTTLGGVKVGSGLVINSGVLSTSSTVPGYAEVGSYTITGDHAEPGTISPGSGGGWQGGFNLPGPSNSQWRSMGSAVTAVQGVPDGNPMYQSYFTLWIRIS
jgi:hypothetical protein